MNVSSSFRFLSALHIRNGTLFNRFFKNLRLINFAIFDLLRPGCVCQIAIIVVTLSSLSNDNGHWMRLRYVFFSIEIFGMPEDYGNRTDNNKFPFRRNIYKSRERKKTAQIEPRIQLLKIYMCIRRLTMIKQKELTGAKFFPLTWIVWLFCAFNFP